LRRAAARAVERDSTFPISPIRWKNAETGAVLSLPAFTTAQPCDFQEKGKTMRAMLIPAALAAAVMAADPVAGTAQARGCLKGAVVGGVAGHFLGRHTILGAGVGCLIGHHEAKKRARERAAQERALRQQRLYYEGR
jgi:hypothetical protein